ncbi:OmpH family outer membrane protein [Salinimicrobium flavum]|uniref:OmpH family outer membrane protein n=1 Tax=Salinimicrobium flavum TaxID=1737065 RepID=A0ABW5J098_9FLAO
MKKFIVLSGLILLSFSTLAQSKVGSIDADYILANLPEMAEVNEDLKSYNEELQKELQTSIQSYETQVKDYQANNATFSEEEKKVKEEEIISLENEIKGFRQKAGVMMQMKRNELTRPLYEKINTAMLKVIETENYTQILHAGGNSIAYSSPEFDITLKVLELLGITIEN